MEILKFPSFPYLLNQDHNVMIIKSKLVGKHVCEKDNRYVYSLREEKYSRCVIQIICYI